MHDIGNESLDELDAPARKPPFENDTLAVNVPELTHLLDKGTKYDRIGRIGSRRYQRYTRQRAGLLRPCDEREATAAPPSRTNSRRLIPHQLSTETAADVNSCGS